jgi:hypothetical protein
MSIYVAEEEALIARSLSDISLSPDSNVSVVIVENKELRCETKLLIENAKYFRALYAFQLGSQVHKKSSSILNPVTLMGGIDYESARVILTGLQSGKGMVLHIFVKFWIGGAMVTHTLSRKCSTLLCCMITFFLSFFFFKILTEGSFFDTYTLCISVLDLRINGKITYFKKEVFNSRDN